MTTINVGGTTIRVNEPIGLTVAVLQNARNDKRLALFADTGSTTGKTRRTFINPEHVSYVMESF